MKTVKLFTALLLAMVCIALSSCNKDKDKDEGDYDRSALVGTWAWFSDTNSEEYWFVFKADGTGYSWDAWDGKNGSKHPFTYVFNEKTSILAIDYEEEGSESAEVVSLTGKKLVLGIEDTYGSIENWTFYRQ